VRAMRRTSCPQPCRVVQFAAAPQPLPATTAALAAHAPSGPAAGATDIDAGVRTAIGLLPSGGRVVVLSDGWGTGGDMAQVAAQARVAGVEIDYTRLTDPTLRYAAVTEIHAPAEVHAGDPVPVQITIRSSVTGPVTLYLERDGVQVGEQTVEVRAGDNPLPLSYTAPAPGWHSFQARVVLFSNDMPENDALGTTVDVVGPPRVLAVAPAGGGALVSLLRGLGFAVTSAQPAALPTSAGALTGEDAVVLDDVPASALHAAQASALSSAVRQGGLGLVVLGGPHSFSLGGFAHTALEQPLPVSSLVPGNVQRRNVAIELVLDHSGSMIDLAGGVPKIDMVHVAGTEVAQFIAVHRDELGIVDFDIVPHTLVPIQRIASTAV
jgi:Ca-activated chloride channel family protein